MVRTALPALKAGLFFGAGYAVMRTDLIFPDER